MPELELVGVNDLLPPDNLAYLLRYDSVYGRYEKSVRFAENALIVEDTTYPVFSEKDPAGLPWKELAVDLVFECTGMFRKKPDMEKHLLAGAGAVILSAPVLSY